MCYQELYFNPIQTYTAEVSYVFALASIERGNVFSTIYICVSFLQVAIQKCLQPYNGGCAHASA